MKVFWWSGGDDGCAWYRMQLPSIALAARGHTTHADTNLNPARWGDADVIVGQRICQPGPSKQWQAWRAQGRRLVFDVDDHYFAFDQTNTDAYAFYTQPNMRQRLADNMGAADVVTCATPRLAEQMRAYNPNTVVVPNGLPAALLDWPTPSPSEKVTIGWAGSPSTAAELPLAAKAIRSLLDRPPAGIRLSLHTIGVDAATITHAGLAHLCTRSHTWIPHSVDYLRHVDFDIWVAPYRPTEFNRAKVPTKALEAAFLGIPIVASDIDGYRQFVRHGETGYLVRHAHEWVTYLRRLATDPELRARMGKAARQQATQHTITRTAAAWERALTGASS